jgi:ribosome biogenesis ATPase
MIDNAMLRPGRLDKLLYVELPNASERYDILRTLARNTPLANDVSLERIAHDERCQGFSGADLASLLREAGVAALRQTLYANNTLNHSAHVDELVIRAEHFETAFSKVTPSVTPQDMKRYTTLCKQYGCERIQNT